MVLPLTVTWPVPFGVKLISPLDTETTSDITGDVKVLFVKVWTQFKVTSPTLDGTTTVKVILT